jgi:hypothetical protein
MAAAPGMREALLWLIVPLILPVRAFTLRSID